MADITEILRLDIEQALRDVNRIEEALDQALSRIELRVDPVTAIRQIDDLAQTADRALSDVDLIIDPSGIQGIERAADNVGQALNRAEGEALDLGLATRDVERNLTESEREALDLERAMNRVDKEADQVVRSTDRIAGGFDKIRDRAGLALGIGAAIAVAGAIRLAGDARTAFADLQDSVNAVKVVFGEASGPVLTFADNVANTAGLSMAAFNQAASVLGSSLINVGFGADVAAQKTIELTQRAADMASIFGGEVSVAVDAILSALRGEGNPIERFGVTLTEAKIKAEAAALGFKTVKGELDSTAKTAAILNIIMRETARTSGDFANTAEDLANAQKIASAEFVNAKAALGEALLPAFQALLAAAPEVLGAIEDLAPAISGLAVSAANLATTTPGMLDFIDVLRLITDLPRGFGQVFDNARIMVEGFGTATTAFSQALTGNFFGAFQTVKEGFEGLGDEAQRSIERINTQGLIDDLRQGGDGATVLANRLADVGRRAKLDPAFIRNLASIAGTDLGQTSAALKALIGDADRLGLEKDDIDALRSVWLGLNETILQSPRALDATIGSLERLPIAPAITALDELRLSADTAGVSMAELALSTDPVIVAMVNALDPADQFALKIDAIRIGAATAGDVFRGNLTPSIGNVSDALDGLSESGASLDEFITNLEEVGTALLNFQTNLSTIALTAPGLAAELGELPIDIAAQLAQQLVEDPIRIAEAEAARTLPGQLATTIRGIVARGVGLLQTNPAQVKAFTEFVVSLDNQAATDALVEGLDLAIPAAFQLLDIPALDLFPTGLQGRETLIDGLITSRSGEASALDASFADLDVDLFDEGAESRASFLAGLSSAQANEERRLRDSIESTLNGAIQRRSPPKLFLDAGLDSGEAFWSGFNQADLTLKTALPGITGKIADGSMPAVGAGSTEINFNLPNLETRDADVTIARATQLAGSVAGILNGNFKL